MSSTDRCLAVEYSHGVSVGLVDDETRRSHGFAFDRAAEVYARSRPGYPPESAAWLAGTTPRQVLDLGAGTGALTAELVGLGHRVVAADPSPAMLVELGVQAPRARRVQAVGEHLPFETESFAVVTVAGAFHWMDQELALPELARVLRPARRPRFRLQHTGGDHTLGQGAG